MGILTYTAKNGIPRQQTVLGGRNMFPEDIAPYTPVTFSVLQPIPNVQTRSASMTWLPNFTEVRIYGHGDLRINGF